MARTGRPPKPVEVKRRLGNPGRRPLPALTEVTILPMASGVPDPPADLGLAGRRLWEQAWGEGITWLSPDSDSQEIEEAARLADDLEVARRRYRVTTDPADARALTSLSKSYTEALSALGFNPVARARLGLAEVKAVDHLGAILARRQRSK